MYNIFNLMPGASLPVLYAQNWNTVSAGLRRNIETVTNYYHDNPMAVQGDHFLVRLLGTLDIPLALNIYRFYDYLSYSSLDLSMALKMTSSIYKGSVFNGVFYGPGTTEVLIAHSEDFDPVDAERNWETLKPIRVLRHPRSDLMMNILDGSHTSRETGFAVIAINIPMLAIQFRAFLKREEEIAEKTGDSTYSVLHYVRMYALPSMIESHLDYVLFNRINNLLNGRDNHRSLKKHSFVIPDYSDRLDAIQMVILRNLAHVGKTFTGILRNVPALSRKDMDQVMLVPDMALTRQVLWALSVSRFPAIDFMLTASRERPDTRNGQEINRLLQALRNIKTSNLITSVLPSQISDLLQDEMDTISRKLRS
jgi:hypothetical protein